jgi:pyruvate formate lyase activating enzyme
VLDSLKSMRQLGLWVEVTMLIVTGLNDDPAELRDAARFIVDELGPQTPWHLNRFHPAQRMSDVLPTPMSTLEMARAIGRDVGLRHVYLGNVQQEANTRCHECGQLLTRRSATEVLQDRIDSGGYCTDCHTPVAGVGMGGAKAVAS